MEKKHSDQCVVRNNELLLPSRTRYPLYNAMCIRVSVLETWAVKFDAERVTVSIASFSSKSASLKQLKIYLVQVSFLIRKCTSEKKKEHLKLKTQSFYF